MSIMNSIRRHINAIAIDQPFTTREFLTYGKRNTIDQGLCRLVKAGYIHRVARGVFVRCDWERMNKFTPLQIATVKAESFGKKIVSHGNDLACTLGLTSSVHNQPTFATSGSSSSFLFNGRRVYFKKANQRKMQLGETPVGKVIRALWSLGEELCTDGDIEIAVGSLNRVSTKELRQRASFMPAWLYSYVRINDWLPPIIATAS